MKWLSRIPAPYLSLGVSMAYALGNGLLGLFSHSWWFITVGAYYAVLSAARFCILRAEHRSAAPDTALFIKRVTGLLLIALSFCLIGMNILSAVKDRGTSYHEIIMITIAAYTFTRLTMAVCGMIRSKRNSALFTQALRNIAFVDFVVSVCSLQRSMLVSFPGLSPAEIRLFNILTGTSAWIIVLLLGLNLTGGKYVIMAKSKLVSVNQKIAEGVTSVYGKIEKGVIAGYKKIEQGAVSGYTKVEDRFVSAYLMREGESVEEAKARLKNQKK